MAENQVAVATQLEVSLPINVRVERRGEVSTTAAEQVDMIQKYVRDAVLAAFGLRIFNRNKVSKKPILFNDSLLSLKLPAVKLTETGTFAEDLPAYYKRIVPNLKQWLARSQQVAMFNAADLENVNVVRQPEVDGVGKN